MVNILDTLHFFKMFCLSDHVYIFDSCNTCVIFFNWRYWWKWSTTHQS